MMGDVHVRFCNYDALALIVSCVFPFNTYPILTPVLLTVTALLVKACLPAGTVRRKYHTLWSFRSECALTQL